MAVNQEEEDVPEHLFAHVEMSMESRIKEGMLLEFMHESEPKAFWIASVTMICGHLLRVRYIGSDEDFWIDINNKPIYPIGWCGKYDEIIEAPVEIKKRHGDSLITMLQDAITTGLSIPKDYNTNSGLTAIDRIKPNMKLEIQNKNDPYKYWIATVKDNIGGRLLLQYAAPESIYDSFWIFYSSPRIKPLGFTQMKKPPWVLKSPDNSHSKFSKEQWAKCLKLEMDCPIELMFPPDLVVNPPKPEIHKFTPGMKIEALDPHTMSAIYPATVKKIFDTRYFLVTVDKTFNSGSGKGLHWLCHSSHPYIFPVGWAKSHNIEIQPPSCWDESENFDWQTYLERMSFKKAPNEIFNDKVDASTMGYKAGMRLEVADPLNKNRVCRAILIRTVAHLLQIKIEYTNTEHFVDTGSTDIFPAGWCSINNYPLYLSSPKTKPTSTYLNNKPESFNDHPSTLIHNEWCDRIFFNYKCYSGPLLSKNKLSQLPKQVGPGPLRLVLREVLNMIISIAYKPGKLLKDWECDGEIGLDSPVEKLKAKLKSNTVHGYVQIVEKNDDIPAFCREMCGKLQACPYLFGPIEIVQDQCPENCLHVDKSKFQIPTVERRGRPKGSLSKSALTKCWNGGKKRKKKGLHYMTIRARERRAAMEAAGVTGKDESGNDSDQSPLSTPQQSEAGTRPNSPDSVSDVANKQPRKKREPRSRLPPLEMKTRGAKLPNFALQMKKAHWVKKDAQTMYSSTCVVPKKQYSSESDNDSDSSDIVNIDEPNISDVSDTEEPELKKCKSNSHYDVVSDEKTFDSSPINSSTMNDTLGKNVFNPITWSVDDVYNYLIKYDECKEIAEKLREEEIDGSAFVYLNLPTMQRHLKMKYEPALQLCKHVNALCTFCIPYDDAINAK